MVANSSAIRAMFEEGNTSGRNLRSVRMYLISALGNPNVPAPEAVKECNCRTGLNDDRSSWCFMAIRTVTVDMQMYARQLQSL